MSKRCWEQEGIHFAGLREAEEMDKGGELEGTAE